MKKMNAAQMLSKAKELIEAEKLAELLVMIEEIHLYLDKFKDIHELANHLRHIQSDLYLTKEFVTIEEAAKYLGFSISQMYKLTSNKEIPYYKPSGKMIFIKLSDLNDWVRQNRIMPATELYKHNILMAGKYMLDHTDRVEAKRGGRRC